MKKVLVLFLMVFLLFGCTDYSDERTYLQEQGYILIERGRFSGFLITDKEGNVGVAHTDSIFKKNIEPNTEIYWIKNVKYMGN